MGDSTPGRNLSHIHPEGHAVEPVRPPIDRREAWRRCPRWRSSAGGRSNGKTGRAVSSEPVFAVYEIGGGRRCRRDQSTPISGATKMKADESIEKTTEE